MVHDPATCDNTVAGVGTCSATYVCQGALGWRCPVATPVAERCNFTDDDCDDEIDEDFRVATGQYVHDANCGSCGVSCAGAIPNATATCRLNGETPRCEVASCDTGYYQASPLTCLPSEDNACLACATDVNCGTPGDRCLELDGGYYCGRDCSAGNLHGTDEGVCPAGYACQVQGDGGQQCVPISGSCACLPGDDGNTRTCSIANDDGTCFGVETCGRPDRRDLPRRQRPVRPR
ncbi:MAG: hypothetical protein CSA66_07605 [Proteobacteria bacterium]|nr:MAG: hypothetical protein CSA66_07605 [Pseudomonadota bacterium]